MVENGTLHQNFTNPTKKFRGEFFVLRAADVDDYVKCEKTENYAKISKSELFGVVDDATLSYYTDFNLSRVIELTLYFLRYVAR